MFFIPIPYQKEFDREGGGNGGTGIGMFYFGARYYDPDMGVWTSTDPADEFWNAYSYCGVNPVNFTDPDGAEINTSSSISRWLLIVLTGVNPDAAESALLNPEVYSAGQLFGMVLLNGWASSSGSSLLEDMKLGIKWTIGGEAHFYRNMNNQYLSFGDAQRQWDLQPDWKSKLHRIGAGNEGNLKFVSPDGHYENVFTPSGRQVWDPRNLGTYNYGTNWATHFLQDMVPYYLLGNSINDPTNVLQRIGGSF